MNYDFYEMAFGDSFGTLVGDFFAVVGVGLGIGVLALLMAVTVRFVIDLFNVL